jgi:integrase/recombinase XerD
MTPDPRLAEFGLYLKLDCGLSENTAKSYTSDLAQFLTWLDTSEKNHRVAAVTHDLIVAWLDSLSNQAVGSRSRARKLSALRLFFKFALSKKWCEGDPTVEIESPKIGRSLPKTLSLDEVEALLQAPLTANAMGDATMLRVLYSSGLRVSELITLPPDAVDAQSGVIRVQGKGDKIRIVPIDPDTAVKITEYLRDIRPGLKLHAHRAGAPLRGGAAVRGGAAQSATRREALFLSRQGRPFTRQGFWKLVRKYARAAGIASAVSPHVLRHAFATHLMERGMNLRSLQMLLGHSDISTTEIYSHVSTPHLHEALNRFHPRRK